MTQADELLALAEIAEMKKPVGDAKITEVIANLRAVCMCDGAVGEEYECSACGGVRLIERLHARAQQLEAALKDAKNKTVNEIEKKICAEPPCVYGSSERMYVLNLLQDIRASTPVTAAEEK